jgi:hypothetical protein
VLPKLLLLNSWALSTASQLQRCCASLVTPRGVTADADGEHHMLCPLLPLRWTQWIFLKLYEKGLAYQVGEEWVILDGVPAKSSGEGGIASNRSPCVCQPRQQLLQLPLPLACFDKPPQSRQSACLSMVYPYRGWQRP